MAESSHRTRDHGSKIYGNQKIQGLIRGPKIIPISIKTQGTTEKAQHYAHFDKYKMQNRTVLTVRKKELMLKRLSGVRKLLKNETTVLEYKVTTCTALGFAMHNSGE